jgi:hypothetical protein
LHIYILSLASLFRNAHLILLLELLIELGVLVIVHDVAVVEIGTHEITFLSVGVTYASDDVAVWGEFSYLSNLLLFPIRHLLHGQLLLLLQPLLLQLNLLQLVLFLLPTE